MRDKTIDVLLQMGVPASIKGFTYICDAIELFDTDPYYPYIIHGFAVKVAESHIVTTF